MIGAMSGLSSSLYSGYISKYLNIGNSISQIQQYRQSLPSYGTQNSRFPQPGNSALPEVPTFDFTPGNIPVPEPETPQTTAAENVYAQVMAQIQASSGRFQNQGWSAFA